MSLNMTGYEIANSYLQAQFSLDIEKFSKLLTKDVELQLTSMGHVCRTMGKDKVTAIFKKKFFDDTSDIDVEHIIVYVGITNLEVISRVVETKQEANESYRAEFNDRTLLYLAKEEDEWKIEKIISQISMKTLGLLLESSASVSC